MMYESFQAPLNPRWTQTILGGGTLECQDAFLRMSLDSTPQGSYSDAQIDDYGRLPRKQFPWKPPVHMELRARFSLPTATADSSSASPVVRGTAGFGFWNYP